MYVSSACLKMTKHCPLNANDVDKLYSKVWDVTHKTKIIAFDFLSFNFPENLDDRIFGKFSKTMKMKKKKDEEEEILE